MIKKSELDITNKWEANTVYPIVSICCITFNHENYIKETIDGFLKQDTNFRFEIIIHDDCSTDQTATIINEYKKQYPNIIRPIFQKENQYSQGKRILPIISEKAKGRYIALCEGDDYWKDPLKLQKQVNFLENNSGYICCFHNSNIIDNNNIIINKKLITAPKDYDEFELLSSNSFITIHSVVYRNIIFYPSQLNKIPFGDIALFHLMGFHGKAKYLPNIEYASYRKHPNGVWNKLNKFDRIKQTIISKKIIKEHLVRKSIPTYGIDTEIHNKIIQSLYNHRCSHDFSSLLKVLYFIIRDKDLSLFRVITRYITSKCTNNSWHT